MSSQFLGFGTGADGAASLSGTDSPIDSACTGTSGATSLSATNASFTANQMILIHQSQGSGVGQWEINMISSYSAGTITTLFPLSYTYASGAQVLVMKQYSSISMGGGFSTKEWSGTTGGIMAMVSSGPTNITSTLSSSGSGFRGGTGNRFNTAGQQGEGQSGTGTNSQTANGVGGGGSFQDDKTGGGGGHASDGGGDPSPNNGGDPGSAASDNSDFTNIWFGGGGGGGESSADSPTVGGTGGDGAGLIFLFSYGIITVTGGITANGNNGGNGGAGNGIPFTSGGGGGAGGGIFLKSTEAVLGTSLITATGGTAGIRNSGGQYNGANGRIRIEACTISGTTNPSANSQEGGFDFCSSANQIL